MTDAPLRAFLMMRSTDGTWTVTVCRDLGAVLRAWNVREGQDGDVAVMHVGFDRPPSQSFAGIADAHPGCMLLTAAAKHVLPNSFVTSAAPVGATESAKVFVGLEGWGYVLEDPTARADRFEPPRMDTVTQKPRGWVASFLNEHPSYAEALSAHGIFDEASYLAGESGLERSVRHRSGVFRAHDLVGGNCEDPCTLARAAPPWLAERALASLDLPVRADNAYRVNGIETVRDLADWSPEKLLHQRNFERKSLRNTLQALTAALNDGPLRAVTVEALSDFSRLLTEIRRSLLSFSDRERDVLVRRLGFQTAPETFEHPTARTERFEPPRTDIVTQEPRGWVVSFLNEHPSDGETLSAHGIFDEDSYLAGESGIERSVRHRSGLFRAHHLVGANCEDPCTLARAAPPWLAERELASLTLPVRADNAYRVNGIETVRDLADWSPEKLLNLRNFGRKSLRDTSQALTTALNVGPLRAVTVEALPDSSRLLTEVRKSLLSFSDRERDVLVRRLGFETAPETLQQVADDYCITRERIRQIELHAIKKWIRDSTWDDIIEQKLSRLMIGRSFPLPVAGVEAIDAWFEGVSSHRMFFRNLVKAICGDRIHMVHIDGLYYFSLMTQEIWERTVSEASALLSSGAGQEWSEDYARSLVHGLLPDTAKEFGTLLWDRLSRFCHYSTGPDGPLVLTGYGRGADQLVEAILAESEIPLHYTEIADRATFREKKNIDTGRARGAAANVGFLFARGTYGLARHILLSDEQMSQVRTEAEDIVCSEASGRQWHSSEILSEISERLDGGFEGLDKYVLDIALAGSSMLRPLGRMTWIAVGADTDESRIDVRQAVVSIVQAAGHPLGTNEIIERLTAVRGVNELFQISPIDPLIRIQPGLWGINDRDVPFSREEQYGLIEDLVWKLEARQSGIHSSELASVVPMRDCPPEAFLSIAIQDNRLRVAQGRYLYLAQWGSPRRESIAHAVSAVLDETNSPLALEEIVALLESRLGRKCDRRVISGALQAQEAEFDESTKKWRSKRLQDTENENAKQFETPDEPRDIHHASIN